MEFHSTNSQSAVITSMTKSKQSNIMKYSRAGNGDTFLKGKKTFDSPFRLFHYFRCSEYSFNVFAGLATYTFTFVYSYHTVCSCVKDKGFGGGFCYVCHCSYLRECMFLFIHINVRNQYKYVHKCVIFVRMCVSE